MAIDLLLWGIALVALIAGTITDLKTREVPDWLNFSLIFAGMGVRTIYASITFEWFVIIEGLAGLALFVLLGYLMYYTGQWGGGDSKMMMGMGALIGLKFTLDPFPLLLVFLFHILLVGALYGMGYSIVLAIIHKKKFTEKFRDIMYSKKIKLFRRVSALLFLLIFIALFFWIRGNTIDIIALSLIVILLILLYLSFYLVVFIKAVEAAAMYKYIPPEKLTEGDWIGEDIIIGGKKIAGPKDLGIEQKQIKELLALKKKGKVDKILVKYGIPFVPSFLLAFIVSIAVGAWWMVLF